MPSSVQINKKRWEEKELVKLRARDEAVMLDFDDTTLDYVLYWARLAMSMFDLQGFLIMRSSEGCYHILFNKIVTWKESMSIVAP